MAAKLGPAKSLWPLCAFLFIVPGLGGTLYPAAGPTSQAATSLQSDQTTSWAVGIVVPEGSNLDGGGKLHWEGVANLTAVVQLPRIGRPDLPIYAVLSVMTEDRSVLQAAVGVYPHSFGWLAFADVVTNVGSVPPAYVQILNSSGPPMSPNALVSISIFRSSSNQWHLRIIDLGTGATTDRAFPVGIAPSIRTGDQEVFALESYSGNQTIFEGMGNLDLLALLIDGRRVSGGVYAYSDWDPAHAPLFVLGSSGTSPPLFIAVDSGSSGSVAWHYVNGQLSNKLGLPSTNEMLLWMLLPGLLVGLIFVLGPTLTTNRTKKLRTTVLKAAGEPDGQVQRSRLMQMQPNRGRSRIPQGPD